MDELILEKCLPMRQQITEYLRREILCGKLRPGTKLPTTKDMAEKWGTQAANVHAALSPLVKEGLLARRQGVGTLVADPNQTLKTVAIFSPQNPGEQISPFRHRLIEEIRSQLERLGKRSPVLYAHNGDMEPIRLMAQRGEFQAVIVPSIDREMIPVFESLPVPYSCMTYSFLRNRVNVNEAEMIDLFVEGLRRQGCRSAGLISSVSLPNNPQENGERCRAAYHSAIVQACVRSGIECRDEWRIVLPDNCGATLADLQTFGYYAIQSLWKQPHRPEGIIVHTDDLVGGVLMGLLNLGISVPAQLKLVLHRNSLLPYLCPVDSVIVETDMVDMANGLIQIVQEQFNGVRCNPYDVACHLITHEADKIKLSWMP